MGTHLKHINEMLPMSAKTFVYIELKRQMSLSNFRLKKSILSRIFVQVFMSRSISAGNEKNHWVQ